MLDPHWSDVTLLLNFSGPDGSSVFVDESGQGNSVTGHGGVQIQSGQLDLDSVDDYISYPYSVANFDPSGAFTIELFVEFDSLSGVQSLYSSADAGYTGGVDLYAFSSKFAAYAADGLSNEVVDVSDPGEAGYLTTGIKYHVELSRDASGDWRLFVDGDQKASTESEIGTAAGHGVDLQIGSVIGGLSHFDGKIDAVRVTNGTARHTSNFTPPTEFVAGKSFARMSAPSPIGVPSVLVEGDPDALIAAPSPLGIPELLARPFTGVRVSTPSPLGVPSVSVFTDFSSLVNIGSLRYVARITGTPELQIPISSWNATLQSERLSFLRCVVPAATQYMGELAARRNVEEVVIYRQATIGSDSVEWEMARAPLSTVSRNKGAYRETATLSGYSDAFTDAPDRAEVALSGVISVSETLGGNVRARAAIDWFLRPGQDCMADDLSFTVDYINYYVTSSGQEYMDVGTS